MFVASVFASRAPIQIWRLLKTSWKTTLSAKRPTARPLPRLIWVYISRHQRSTLPDFDLTSFVVSNSVLIGATIGVIFWGFVTASHRMKDTQRGSLFSRWRQCNSARIAQEVLKQVFYTSDWSRFVTRHLRENASCQAACETASASTLLFGKN
jgi:hypothetical protein